MADRDRPPLEAGTALRHYDRSQLWFQVEEIFNAGSYTRHGVSVGEGDVVLDVGANVGVAAAFFAERCGAAAVHSFEPIPALFALLRENVAEFAACVPHDYGLGASSRRVTMTYYPGAAAMSGMYADPERDRELVETTLINYGLTPGEAAEQVRDRYRPVPVECRLRTLSEVLDELEVDRVDLLKIDVERAELDVLAGVSERHWPLIRQVVAEVHDEDDRCAAISSALAERGFQVVDAQDEYWAGTPVRMIYAGRPNPD